MTFKLEEIKKKPVKELTSHEFYLRYKDVIKKNNKKNYKKYGKKFFADAVKRYADKNKEKIKAKDKARWNIPIPDGQICQVLYCNKPAIQRHHEDYSKPMEVIFVCRECHGELDRQRRIKENE